MNIFEKLKHGDPVDMMSEEYRPAVVELHRADRALFHLNHTEPHTVDGDKAQIKYTSVVNANAYGARRKPDMRSFPSMLPIRTLKDVWPVNTAAIRKRAFVFRRMTFLKVERI